MRRLSDLQGGTTLFDKLRPSLAPVLGWLASGLAAWFTSKGVELTAAQLLVIFGPLGGLLEKLIAAVLNPNDAAAPSMVKMAPQAPYQAEKLAPIPAAPDFGPLPPRPTFTVETTDTVEAIAAAVTDAIEKRTAKKPRATTDVVRARRKPTTDDAPGLGFPKENTNSERGEDD